MPTPKRQLSTLTKATVYGNMGDSLNELGSYMDHALSLNGASPKRPSHAPPPVPVPPSQQPYSAAGSPTRPGAARIPGYIPQKDPYNLTGASQQTRKVVDEQGQVKLQTIRKGVEDFVFADELGVGSYSTVVAASDKQTLRQYAIKILDKVHIIKENKVKYVEIEKNTLNRLGEHPGIIHLYYTFQDRASLFFVLDFAPNGELLHLIKKTGSLDIPCSRYYTAQLLDAVEYMHANGVVHRDLKPENILLDYKMRIKITDFGTAKLLDKQDDGTYPKDTRANSFVGTAEYVSPELLNNKYQGKSADVWAIGCILYQMIAGQPPFQGATQFLTFQRIIAYTYKVPPGFPFLVRDLLKHVLVTTRVRWSIERIKDHPLFEGVDFSTRALWGSGPPKIQPYKPTSSTMAAPPGVQVAPPQPRPPMVVGPGGVPRRAGAGGHPGGQPQVQSQGQARRAQAQGQGAPSGGAPSGPISGTSQPPQSSNSSSQPHLSTGQRRAASQPQASAAAAALYRRPGATAGYHAGQERLQAIKKQVQQAKPRTHNSPGPSAGSVGQGSTSGSQGSYNIPVHQSSHASSHAAAAAGSPGASSGAHASASSHVPSQAPPRIHTHARPASPRSNPASPKLDSPTLPTPQISALDQEWASVLSRNEHIINLDVAATGTISSAEGEGDTESKFIKLFSSKKKMRTVILTTFGRLLLINEERKLKGEVLIGSPQVRVRRIERSKGGIMYIVDTYSRTFTLENLNDAPQWYRSMELAKRYFEQMEREAERNARGAATAAAIAVARR